MPAQVFPKCGLLHVLGYHLVASAEVAPLFGFRYQRVDIYAGV